MNWKYAKLGFLEQSHENVKANGLAIQVMMLAVEYFTVAILPVTPTSSFTAVASNQEHLNKNSVRGSVFSEL